MRLHRFITTFTKIGNDIVISDEKALHQLFKVFRMRVGDSLIICDNDYRDVVCEITERTHTSVTCRIVEEKNIVPDTRKIIIALAMIKKESFEYALEKMTEVGVTDIVPLMTKRTVKIGFRRERYEDILREATEQSGRGKIPKLHEPISLQDYLDQSQGLRLVADVVDADDGTRPGKNAPKEHFSPDDTARTILIGPEGGWDEAERSLFTKHHIPKVSFGSSVLRAETAAMIAGWYTKNN
jgi:16S rRNA (uracil1498-N3)-methyltransferase